MLILLGMSGYCAIVPAAGLSSRMGGFKPLLELQGRALIERTVQSALSGGVRRVCVVTGRQAADVEAALQGMAAAQPERLCFAHNAAFASSDMLASIKLGLAAVGQKASGVYVLPGDLPLVAAGTFVALRREMAAAAALVAAPCHEGKTGHPLLVAPECFEAILSHSGGGGLRSALAGCEWLKVPVEDPGILMDADTPEDVALLDAYSQAHR